MNVAEMMAELKRRGVDTHAIFTGTGNPEDRYAIVKENDFWHVYYSERGEKFELRQLSTEAEACEYLLRLLAKDQTI